ncbi:hypothetical protein K466DRAFT_228569 [Polyporus arcularius HHB13444]|uniref:DUF6699 domain-containing protein n=1 Tax=Polyporus arcularius HHB13444 TaxID=1314778 RepID=A0A5C3PRP7_9APHY|nr:hypothetical protein K466DRAFT_228569 [Polyporus arcularius HHB13444]
MICFTDIEVPRPVPDCDADLEELHPALQGVTFEAVPWIISTRSRAEDAYAFRHPIHLGCHPLAYRSFASFPPVQSLRLLPPKGIKLGSSVVENRIGVTVYDILEALHVSLDIHVDPKELREYMWDFPPGIHKDSVKTFRNLLSIIPMKKIVAEKQPGQSRASCFVNKDV